MNTIDPHLFRSATLATLVTCWGSGLTLAGEVRIVTWNVKDIFSVEDVNDRASDLTAMASTTKPDILCLQEITSLPVAEAIAHKMNLNAFHVACSDFVQSDGAITTP